MSNDKQLEEAKEVLKNPFDCSLRDLELALKGTFPLANISELEVCRGYLRVDVNNYYLDLNLSKISVDALGRFNVLRDGEGVSVASHLEKHFKYPLLPTEEERTLFEIEFGFEYPLKVDNAPIQVDEVSVGSDKA